MKVVQLHSYARPERTGQVSVWEYVCALQDAADDAALETWESELFVAHALLDALEEDADRLGVGVPLALAA